MPPLKLTTIRCMTACWQNSRFIKIAISMNARAKIFRHRISEPILSTRTEKSVLSCFKFIICIRLMLFIYVFFSARCCSCFSCCLRYCSFSSFAPSLLGLSCFRKMLFVFSVVVSLSHFFFVAIFANRFRFTSRNSSIFFL